MIFPTQALRVLLIGPMPHVVMACVVMAGSALGQSPVVAVSSTEVPLSVATVEIPLQTPVLGDGLPTLALVPHDRVHFAVSKNLQTRASRRPSEQPLPPLGRGRLLGRVGNLIREIAGADDQTQTVARRLSFLFEGDTPFSIQVTDRGNLIGAYEVQPVIDPNAYGSFLSQWWSDFTEQTKQQIDSTDMPPWVPTYSVAMLSSRLGLPLPAWYGEESASEESNPLLMTLKWVGGAAEIADEIFASAAIGSSGPMAGSVDVTAMDLPATINWQSSDDANLPEGAPEPTVEPLANRVPPECFYIRYGKFENYLWFQDLTAEFGGDISRMITLSGLSNDGAARLQKQLGIQMTAMGRLMGPSVITDQALIGRDLFLQDGAAMGVVFQPTSVFVLRTSLTNDRQQLASESESISLKNVELAHGQGTLLRSSDNSIRSYMVEHDGFICVTNSESIADRFLEVGKDGKSLGKTQGFRKARHWMPLERDDTIFAYFSPEMLQGLMSPQYLIELRRRMQSEADIALVHLARLAAEAFRADGESTLTEIDQLVGAGFLPNHFGVRADGSGVVSVGERVMDTRRGSRGTFLPIPDNPIDRVTTTEAEWFREIAVAYEDQFPSFDPIYVGVQREVLSADENPKQPSNEKRERLIIHAEIAPWQAESYGWWAQQLGPPTQVAIRFADDDLIAVQAHVASDQLGPPTHLFVGIKDTIPPKPEAVDGVLSGYRALKGLPGYLGAYPYPGALDRLPLGLGRGTPVGPGMNRLLGGVYRFTGGGFSVLSFQPEILNATLPVLAAEEVDDIAQARAHVGNLRGSQLEGYFNSLLYDRSATTSLAGAEFLESLTNQLNVPPSSASNEAAKILGGSVQCTLGGQYQAITESEWASTAWGDGLNQPASFPPAGYQAPILQWFRGLDAKVTQYPNRLVADAVIDVARVGSP